jgi:hypothetical protein
MVLNAHDLSLRHMTSSVASGNEKADLTVGFLSGWVADYSKWCRSALPGLLPTRMFMNLSMFLGRA